ATEVVRAQADQARECGERYRLGQMVLDVGRDCALFPGRKAAFRRGIKTRRPSTDPTQFMRHDGTQPFDVMTTRGRRCLDLPPKLSRRIQQSVVLEEQLGRQG